MGDVKRIKTGQLVPFENHPFALYEGERLEEMIESVKESGVYTPLLVRPKGADTYEILSGHNRWNAAVNAEIDDVPCVVMDNLTDDEAMLVVTETNLNQRSFSDMKHSERAFAIKMHLEALKGVSGGQGHRNDLISMMFSQENGDNKAENETLTQFGTKLRTNVQVGENFGLSKNTVARYVRLTFLIQPLLELVDDNKIGLIPGVNVSYLTEQEQQFLEKVLAETGLKLDLKKSEELKFLHEKKAKKGGMFEKDISKILKGVKKTDKPKESKEDSIKIPKKTYTRFFDDDTPKEKIAVTIERALAFYYEAVQRGEIKDDEDETGDISNDDEALSEADNYTDFDDEDTNEIADENIEKENDVPDDKGEEEDGGINWLGTNSNGKRWRQLSDGKYVDEDGTEVESDGESFF